VTVDASILTGTPLSDTQGPAPAVVDTWTIEEISADEDKSDDEDINVNTHKCRTAHNELAANSSPDQM
jgi:hypothetical protein